MKAFRKVILFALFVVCIAIIVWVFWFIWNEKSISKNSTYCMDKIRWELWEQLSNVVLMYVDNSELWKYVYSGSVSFNDEIYFFSCVVFDKDNVDLKLNSVESDDDKCNEKFIHWVESNWKINNDVVDDVDYRYDAQVFYSPVTESCVWWTTLAEYDNKYKSAKVEYNIYDLEKDWRIFQDKKDTMSFTGKTFWNIEEFLENALVNEDILEKLEYYKSGMVLDEEVVLRGDNFDNGIENDLSISWETLN